MGLGHPCGHFGTHFEIFLKFFHLWVNRTFFSFVGLGRRCGHFETIAISTPPIQRPEAPFCEKIVTHTIFMTINRARWAYTKISQLISSLTPFGHFTVLEKYFQKVHSTSAGDDYVFFSSKSHYIRDTHIAISTIFMTSLSLS